MNRFQIHRVALVIALILNITIRLYSADAQATCGALKIYTSTNSFRFVQTASAPHQTNQRCHPRL